jgi:hypothetical protein
MGKHVVVDHAGVRRLVGVHAAALAVRVTPIRPSPAHEASFIRGIRSCVAMLENTFDSDEFFVQGTHRRRGAQQNNIVRQTLDGILGRSDDSELEGFCAVLTEICAIADNSGDYEHIFGKYANRRERVLRRRYRASHGHT